jgi:hypothetical protein
MHLSDVIRIFFGRQAFGFTPEDETIGLRLGMLLAFLFGLLMGFWVFHVGLQRSPLAMESK